MHYWLLWAWVNRDPGKGAAMRDGAANCQHYVTVSLKPVEVTAYDRSDGWKGRSLTRLAESLALPALGLSMPVADIYRWTPLGQN
jgi:hypothetical protein